MSSLMCHRIIGGSSSSGGGSTGNIPEYHLVIMMSDNRVHVRNAVDPMFVTRMVDVVTARSCRTTVVRHVIVSVLRSA